MTTESETHHVGFNANLNRATQTQFAGQLNFTSRCLTTYQFMTEINRNYQTARNRLRGAALEIVTEQFYKSWDELRQVLINNFGNQRSELNIKADLTRMKQSQKETHIEFYYRIINILAILNSKISLRNGPDIIRKYKIIDAKSLALRIQQFFRLLNLAVALSDALIENQTTKTFAEALVSKLDATENLDFVSRQKLEFVSRLNVMDALIMQDEAIVASQVLAEINTKPKNSNEFLNKVSVAIGIKNLNHTRLHTPLFNLGLDSVSLIRCRSICARRICARRHFRLICATKECQRCC
ncbi:hypothetical protein FQA39_LY12253 [Lamprigera yunnana]|nr:hypothetical protein FQA39_LY12253 [Lamprigera yunnana]